MHLLPTNLGRLAEHAKDGGGRSALDNVRLKLHCDNTFLAEATDTKVLIRVSGPCAGLQDEFPDCVPGLATAPNGQLESLVPAAAWKKTFNAAKKLTGGRKCTGPRAVAVKIGDKVATFGTTDTVSNQCESVANGEGRYPPTGDILGQSALRRGGEVRFAVDPLLLAELLRTTADVACDEQNMRVEFEVRNPNHPIHIHARHPDGIVSHAIIMPLAKGVKNGEKGKSAGNEEATVPAGVVELEKQLGNLTAQCNSQNSMNGSKRR